MRDGVYDDEPRPARSTGLIVWLVVSVLLVAGVLALNAYAEASIPDDCPACGMAMIGMVPYWLLAYTGLVVTVVVVAVHLIRRRRTRLGAVSLIAAAYGLLSLVTVVWLAIAVFTA